MIVPFAAAAIAVGVGGADGIAPPARCAGAGAGGIFPFRFAGQPVGSCFGRPAPDGPLSPAHSARRCKPGRPSRTGTPPASAVARPATADRRGRGLPLSSPTPGADCRARADTGWPAQEGEKLLAGDMEFSQGEGLHRHDMLRPFGIETARLMRRAAHQEFSAPHTHHLRALRTFAKTAQWLRPGIPHSKNRQKQRSACH
jgi:hypothetical protein